MPTFLLVAPEGPVRDLLSGTVAGLGHQAAAASDAPGALRAALSVRPDALVLDIAAADDAQEFLGTLFAVTGRLPVVFIATVAARWAPGSLPLDPSLDQLLVKPFAADQLHAAISAVLGVAGRRPARMLPGGSLLLDHQTHEARGSRSAARLTPTEFHLLDYLAARPGAVVTFGELLEKVWGFAPGTGSREIVRAHVKNLRAKLRDCGHDPIETLPRRGYRLAPGAWR